MLKLFAFEIKKIHRSAVFWICVAVFAVYCAASGFMTGSVFNDKEYMKDAANFVYTDEQIANLTSDMTEEEKAEFMEQVEWQKMIANGATEEQLSKMSESERRAYEAARSGEAYYTNKEEAEFYTDHDVNTGFGTPSFIETSFENSTVLIILISVIISSIIAREYSNGTIKLSLISPHRRDEIIFSKISAVFTVIIETALIAAFMCALTGVVFFMVKGIPNPEPFGALKAATIGGELSVINAGLRLVLLFLICVLETFMYSMFVFLISLLSKNIAITIITPVALTTIATVFGTDDQMRKNVIWNHLFFNLKDNYLIWGASSTSTTALWTALLAAAIWALLFMAASVIIFDRQDVYN